MEIGHRNYTIINFETLTAEEKAAVESARRYEGISGTVPISYEVKNETDWVIDHGRCHYTMGYTIVLDQKKNVRFIQKGYLTCDQISLLNKGKKVDEALGWMKYTIFLIQQSMK